MSETKTKILSTSLSLFNEHGLTNVSLRSIADAMNISVGNLQYHFKKREEIILALYFQMVETIDQVMVPEVTKDTMIQAMSDISRTTFLCFFDFRFFLLDFNLIIREHPPIKKHYKGLLRIRKQQFLAFGEILIANGLMRPAILPDEYDHLFTRMQILSDFWVSAAAMQTKKFTKKVMLEYLKVIDQALFPYLTDKGREQFMEINQHST